MYKLEMQTPTGDVLRLLMGRLSTDEDRLADWLHRGREPFENLVSKFYGSDSRRDEAMREWLFPATDPTPVAIRTAAYQVEARRSLLRAIDELAGLVLVFALVLAALGGFGIGLWAGIVFAVLGLALAGWIRIVGLTRAKNVLPFGQRLEPLAWALYYPAQIAQEILDVQSDLEAADYETFGSRLKALTDSIRWGPDDTALPGQERQVEARILFGWRHRN